MIELGRRVEGKARLIPPSLLMKMESVPDSVYQIEIQTKGVRDEKAVVDTLVKGLREKFGVKVIWISVNKPKDMIKLQIVGSPFAWSALLLFLPTILLAIGVIVVLIAVFLIIVERPVLAALAVVGLALIGVGAALRGRGEKKVG